MVLVGGEGTGVFACALAHAVEGGFDGFPVQDAVAAAGALLCADPSDRPCLAVLSGIPCTKEIRISARSVTHRSEIHSKPTMIRPQREHARYGSVMVAEPTRASLGPRSSRRGMLIDVELDLWDVLRTRLGRFPVAGPQALPAPSAGEGAGP